MDYELKQAALTRRMERLDQTEEFISHWVTGEKARALRMMGWHALRVTMPMIASLVRARIGVYLIIFRKIRCLRAYNGIRLASIQI